MMPMTRMIRGRVMRSVSRAIRTSYAFCLRRVTRGESGPKHFKGLIDSRMQSAVAMKAPHQESAENGLAEDLGEFGRGKIIANVAALLAQLNHLRVESENTLLHFEHGFANGRRAGEETLKQRANNGRITHGLLGHARSEGAEELRHGFIGVARF